MIKITGLDHLVLTVTDLAASIDFYTRVLGMEVVTFGNDRKALRFGQQKINLHVVGHEIAPRAEQPVPGSADLCFLTADLEEARQQLERAGITILVGPVERHGAKGTLKSLYFRDPDANLIELSVYL